MSEFSNEMQPPRRDDTGREAQQPPPAADQQGMPAGSYQQGLPPGTGWVPALPAGPAVRVPATVWRSTNG